MPCLLHIMNRNVVNLNQQSGMNVSWILHNGGRRLLLRDDFSVETTAVFKRGERKIEKQNIVFFVINDDNVYRLITMENMKNNLLQSCKPSSINDFILENAFVVYRNFHFNALNLYRYVAKDDHFRKFKCKLLHFSRHNANFFFSFLNAINILFYWINTHPQS